MNAKTKTALMGSIKKWERIVKSTKAEDVGTANCPLCRLFYWEGEGCEGCPVATARDRRFCSLTPYTGWANHQIAAHVNIHPKHREEGCEICLGWAKKELAFLRSLLPKGEKP